MKLPLHNRLSRYIGQYIIKSIMLTCLILWCLFWLIFLLEELGDISKGNYRFSDALYISALQCVGALIEFSPMISLIGCILGLGQLASHRELIAMMSVGITRQHIVYSSIKICFLFSILVLLFHQLLLPQIEKHILHYKTQKTDNTQYLTKTNTWLKINEQFIHIGSFNSDGTLSDISIYEFKNTHLSKIYFANTATKNKNKWQLNQVYIVTRKDETNKQYYTSIHNWPIDLPPKELKQLFNQDNQSHQQLIDLLKQIRFLKMHQIDTRALEWHVWKTLLKPLSIVVMVLIAAAFIFGSLRDTPMGHRLLFAISTGLVFHVLMEMIGHFVLLTQIPILFVALLPPVLFTSVGWLILRYKKF